jgi:hypothetical protein
MLALFPGFRIEAQAPSDTLSQNQPQKSADDPSLFLTRVEIFNEFQHYDKATGFNINQTVVRTIVKIGKRFTTRLDVPLVSNTVPNDQGYSSFGLGDISIRLLGYKFLETRRSAITASVEFQFNTADSPILGTGKELIIPVLSYSTLLKGNKNLVFVLFQQVNSIGGDEQRSTVNFSKIQSALIHYWSRRLWTVVANEFFIDYENGGTSMIMKCRMTGIPAPRLNMWAQINAGLYGDFIGRYDWGAEVGCRYFLWRN